MKRNQWNPEDLKAIKADIAQGFISEMALREVGSILTGMENALLKQFSEPNPIYYQNLDNSPLFVLHLKLRVIKELQESLKIRVDMGRSALEQRSELEQQGAKFDE